jgi:hypothetical protein
MNDEETQAFEDILGIPMPEITQEIVSVPPTVLPVVSPAKPTNTGDNDGEEDYRSIRSNLKHIISKTEEAVDRIMDLAKEGEEPRAYEVVADLLRANLEANDRLIQLHKQRKDIQKKDDGQKPGNVTNNNTIIATTTELLDLINKNRKKVASTSTPTALPEPPQDKAK